MNTIITLIPVFVIALSAVVLLMPLVIRLASRINAVDDPDHRKIHAEPIPVLGGVAIALGFMLACLTANYANPLMQTFLAGFAVITLTGLADDLWQLRPLFKFSGEILASLVFLTGSGTALHSFGYLFSPEELTTGRYALAVSFFCMIGVINAINMADGLDGLAGGISLMACLFLVYFSIFSGQPLLTSILAALTGCLIVFLYYNRYPAKVFMGDTGSLALGYVLSTVCILMVQRSAFTSVAPVSMAIVMGLPVVDAILVMTLRIMRGKNPFAADNTHLHHRLMALGFSHPGTVRVIYSLVFSCGVLAVLVRGLPEWIQFYAGLVYAALIFGTVYILQYRGFTLRQN